MSVPEFADICMEVFTYDKEAGKLKVKFPDGCDKCPSELEWDCYHVEDDGEEVFCPWREKYWKYEEVKKMYSIYKAQEGGMDLNRIETLTFNDFSKISILKSILR